MISPNLPKHKIYLFENKTTNVTNMNESLFTIHVQSGYTRMRNHEL